MTARRLLFWLHLCVGVTVGLVVAFLAITGSILAFQTQIIGWAERGSRISDPVATMPCVAPSALLTNAADFQHRAPSSLTLFADRHRPAEVMFGRDAWLLVHPCTGEVIGHGASVLRAFFANVRDLHRWIAWGGVRHEGLRSIKDACNLAFFFLLLSGLVLWIPRKFSWQHWKASMLFRPGLRARARDWNLHNIFGFWMALPLACIVLTGAIMSYAWMNTLLYRAAGSEPPKARAEGEPRQAKPLAPEKYASLDAAIQKAMTQDSQWKSLQMRMPSEKDAMIAFTVDEGDGGRPQQRAQLMIGRKDAKVMRWEPFSAVPRGRQWRLYARFLHTGEIFGPIGEFVALLAALSALGLVWTGFALAIRRWIAWRRRKAMRAEVMLERQEVYSEVI